MAAGHESTEHCLERGRLQKTSLVHKIEVIQAIKEAVEGSQVVSDWVASVVSGLVYTDVSISRRIKGVVTMPI